MSAYTLRLDASCVEPLRDDTPSRAQIEALARVVLAPGVTRVLRVDAENAGAGWVSLDAALDEARAFAIEVAVDVLAVDFDLDDFGPPVAEIANAIEGAGFAPVVLASGRGAHVFARIGDEITRVRLARAARALGGDARRMIRPPLSPHRLGLPVELIEPCTVEDVIEALAPVSPVTPPDDRSKLGAPGKLSSRAWDLLRHGDQDDRFHSRSEAIQSAVTSMVLAGWGSGLISKTLRDRRNRGAAKLHEIEDRHGSIRAARYIDHSIRRAQDFVTEHPLTSRNEVIDACASIEATVDAHAWTGTAGGTDSKVLAVLIDIARAAYTITDIGVTDRRGATLAGCSRTTWSASTNRLIDAGWLAVSTAGSLSESTRYTLAPALARADAQTCANYRSHAPRGGVRDLAQLCAHPLPGNHLFRYAAQGGNARRVLIALDAGTKTTPDLVARLGLHRRTVTRLVDQLQSVGLVVIDTDTGIITRTGAELDAVAVEHYRHVVETAVVQAIDREQQSQAFRHAREHYLRERRVGRHRSREAAA